MTKTFKALRLPDSLIKKFVIFFFLMTLTIFVVRASAKTPTKHLNAHQSYESANLFCPLFEPDPIPWPWSPLQGCTLSPQTISGPWEVDLKDQTQLDALIGVYYQISVIQMWSEKDKLTGSKQIVLYIKVFDEYKKYLSSVLIITNSKEKHVEFMLTDEKNNQQQKVTIRSYRKNITEPNCSSYPSKQVMTISISHINSCGENTKNYLLKRMLPYRTPIIN